MVNLSNILSARGPHLIYGVKRGKVPTKLRPTVVATKTITKRAPCTEEMFKLLTCWKRNTYSDAKCSDEIGTFMKCAQRHMDMKANQTTSDAWTSTDVNKVLKQFTELKGPRDH
ncbi:coiled-coil-helix-coiled-coil-helix domain-containing protein 1-like [Actinia tenebrosa]|uniref:Coiled-coil-helix-coiled-coil-helix domain-containing protein 1-like n=1 Tax=Actinia tenebrosa TaxID=6105 RepID=A0A6P8HN11_ACTTE|nr:coiled-coil-helix-coiled-coil-helix domain-containing protein 1-like [Actinia tenebrosa]